MVITFIAGGLATCYTYTTCHESYRDTTIRLNVMERMYLIKPHVQLLYPFRIHAGAFIIAWDEIPCYSSDCPSGNIN